MKSAEGKQHIAYSGTMITMTEDFSSEINGTEDVGQYFQSAENDFYPAKISLKNKEEVNTF